MNPFHFLRKKRLIRELRAEQRLSGELRTRLPSMGLAELEALTSFYQGIDARLAERREEASAIWEKVRSGLPSTGARMSFRTDAIINAISMQLLAGKAACEIEREIGATMAEKIATFRSEASYAPAKTSSAGYSAPPMR